MTKKLFILSILLLWGIPVFAQSVDTAWVRIYNGGEIEIANAIAIDTSGNVYVTGESFGSGTGYDYATIKYDTNGDTVWLRRYNGPANNIDRAYAIAVDGSENVYVTGQSDGGSENDDYATIKYYPNGDTAWVRRYDGPVNGSDVAKAIEIDGSGNAYVTGYSYGSGTDYDYATIKYNPNGDTAWVRRYNGPVNDDDEAGAIAVDNSGNVYVTGYSEGNGTSRDYATIKYHSNGDTAWVRRYNGQGNDCDQARAIAVDSFGNVYVTGESDDIGVSYGYDYTTIKYYSSGDTAWVRRYNGPENSGDLAYAIAVDGSGNVYVTGESNDSGWISDYATIKYDSNGDTAWVRRYNGPENSEDRAYAIAVDGSGNVYVTGESSDSGWFSDYATIKYDSNGDTAWVRRYDGPGEDSYDQANDIAVDGSGNVYVTGYSWSNDTYDDYATIKYVPYICGDANGDGHVSVSDVVYVMDYISGDQAPDPLLSGNADGCGIVNIADAVYVNEYLFKSGSAPSNCSETSDWCSQVIAGNTIMVGCPPSVYPGGDSVAIPIYISNTDPLSGFTLGFNYPSDSIEITSIDTSGTIIPEFLTLRSTFKPDSNQVLVSLCILAAPMTPQNGGLLFTLNARILSGSPNQSIDLDSVFVAPAGEFIFAPAGGGVIHPAFSKCVRDDILTYIAYSPVDLIVTDPIGDSIGVDFNTISGATYDTTQDVNQDGDNDDVVIISKPLIGEYTVRVVGEPGSGGGSYTLAVKLNGNEDTPMVAGTAPEPGEVDTVYYTVIEYLKGDANTDGSTSISDVIFLINYLFKGGTPPSPLLLGDANCCKEGDGSCTVVNLSVSDVIYLINYLFKGGDAPCS